MFGVPGKKWDYKKPNTRRNIMKIKISVENKAKIEATLKKINGRATAHTFTLYSEIAAIASYAEQEMNRVYKNRTGRAGAEVYEESGDSLPNSYKYTATQTAVTLKRGSDDWFLVSVESAPLFAGSCGKRRLRLTIKQHESINSRCPYDII
jgi:hypothetical protein